MSVDVNGESLLCFANRQFDALREKGQLFWEESVPEHIEHNGFKFEFRIVPAFGTKPLPKGNHPAVEKKDPFLNPEEGFVLKEFNSTHVLQFNKYCIYRPQLILHTKLFASQTDDLDFSDFTAALGALNELKAPWVLFYNCGLRAGSSQGHKHMQLIPKPAPKDFILFPDQEPMQKLLVDPGLPCRPPKVSNMPYDCLVTKVPRKGIAEDLLSAYQTMLEVLHKPRQGNEVYDAHNMIMTLDWMCVIPRQARGEEGINTNAMGMMGLVWVKSQEERNGWNKLGLDHELRVMGAPRPEELVMEVNGPQRVD